MATVYRDTPTGIHRLNKMPFDDKEIFESITDLFTYINNGAAYQGQKCLVKLPYFEQDVILKQGRGSKLVPVFNMPSGYSWITQKRDNDLYALIYYYNGGSVFTNKNEQVRITDSFAWGLLPHAGLIAGSDTNIPYLLEYNDGTEHSTTFTQANFCTQSVAIPTGATAINRISSTENSKCFFPTANENIMIMPKIESNIIVRLWVKCNDYDAALGV